MTQEERLIYLINDLSSEAAIAHAELPTDTASRKRLLRSLMNIRPPKMASQTFLDVQDAYLQEELAQKGIVSLSSLPSAQTGIYIWQGDITRLSTDAIVNAANSTLLGCFVPCHGCIDNAIHSAAGVQLRLECARLMENQHTEEPTGTAKITKAYNLPCRYVLHTVGPIIHGEVSQRDCSLLAGCYRSCLELAEAYRLKSIAFCCISTGEFHFPNKKAAEIAVKTVLDYQKNHPDSPEVVFNVFKDHDKAIYQQLLGEAKNTRKPAQRR